MTAADLTEPQRRVVDVLARGGTFLSWTTTGKPGILPATSLRTVEALRDRGLVEADVLALTPAGRELYESGEL